MELTQLEKTLCGVEGLDSGTPILDVVESLQRRFVVLDPARAMFSRQGDVRVLDAVRPGQELLVGDTADRPDGASGLGALGAAASEAATAKS